MRLPRVKSLILALLVLVSAVSATPAIQAKDMEFPFARRQKVPPLPPNLTWLNTAGPLELHELRGKFVLLDFWTYCCINCMHILPELKKLEQAWPKNLVVIGVHSAKFETEQDSQNIRAAIQRYKIEHPVINDARHELWELFGVQAWPTVILIDPEGYAVWGTSGEITFEQVDKVLRAGDALLSPARGCWTKRRCASIWNAARPPTRRSAFPARSWPTRPRAGCSSPTAITTASSSPSSTARCST